MRTRGVIIVLTVLAVGTLMWTLRDHGGSALDTRVAATATREPSASPEKHTPQSIPERYSNTARKIPTDPAPAPDSPVDAVTRARFNEQARSFFAHASELPSEERAREAERLERELSRLEHAGGMSAGETFLIRAGLIRETVSDPAQQTAQIRELRDRYASEARTRMAAANARFDPAFESYKIAESEIVKEVMSMQTIPDGMSRDEYLRQRLQSAREALMP